MEDLQPLYLFFETETPDNAIVGKNIIRLGKFDSPLKLKIVGAMKGHVISDGVEISTDKAIWSQRLTLDFDKTESIWIKEADENSPEITTISVEPA